MIIDIIDDVQLLEGIVGAVCMPLFILFFKYTEGFKFMLTTILAFFFTWLARKISINNYSKYKLYYTKNPKKYMFRVEV